MMEPKKNGELKRQVQPKGTLAVYRSADMDKGNTISNNVIYELPVQTTAINKHGSKELLPAGGWHGVGEQLPNGGWHGVGEELPAGGWHGVDEELPAGGWHGVGEELPAGGWHGVGEELPAGGWHGVGEQLPAGGWHNTINAAGALPRFVNFFKELFGIETNSYTQTAQVVEERPYAKFWHRTLDGKYYFLFGFHWEGAYYEVDILESPNYTFKDAELINTHQLPSSRGGQLICFGTPEEVTTLQKAQAYTEAWSALIVRYITTGEKF